MVKHKTENGMEFPAAAYLHVPDPDVPSGWKLRVWESPDAKQTQAQLGRAAAALGPGFRGSRAQMAPADRAAAVRKLRAMYKAMGVEPDAMPSVMQNALHVAAGQRARRNGRAVAEQALAAGGPASAGADLLEDLETLSESSYYGSMIAAMQGGALSFETVLCAAQAALDEYHRAEHLTPDPSAQPAPGVQPHPYDCSMKLVATFPGALVYEMKGKLYQTSYGIEGTTCVLAGDGVEVTADFVPVAGEAARMDATRTEARPPLPVAAPPDPARQEARPDAARDLWEAAPSGHLSEARINRVDRVIEGCVLLNAESVNGPSGRRVYTDAALRQVAQMSEGLPAYANHVAKELAFKPRDVTTIIGRHRNPRFDAARHRVVTDLHVLEHQAPWVFSLTEELGDVVGNSLVSRGFAKMEGGVEIIERVDAVRSGDLVSDPATTKGLFEHREQWAAQHTTQHEGGGDTMDITLSGITEFLKAHPVEATALREHVAGESLAAAAKDKVDLGAKLAEAVAEKAAAVAMSAKLTGELTESKAKLDGYSAADALGAKRVKLQEAVAAHDLGKRFGKIDGAVSPLFLSTCLEQDEAKWPGLLEDRLKIMDGASRASAAPQSQVKQEAGALPAGIHGRLSTALVG